ncbi:hypothetical protein, partial [Pseudomonas aeruginosa]|uniref:hypothetical protein n=1 Tax=Pseudomonas aeruginosa TaxID=287 RepID=UPI001980E702
KTYLPFIFRAAKINTSPLFFSLSITSNSLSPGKTLATRQSSFSSTVDLLTDNLPIRLSIFSKIESSIMASISHHAEKNFLVTNPLSMQQVPVTNND